MTKWDVEDPNGTDYFNLSYEQPRCNVCGRFASRDNDGSWIFNCVKRTGREWEHD